MIHKILKKILLEDILKSLYIGIKCLLRKPVTIHPNDITRSSKFRRNWNVNHDICIKCLKCAKNCPTHAITCTSDGFPKCDLNKCCYCNICKKGCPKSAIKTN